MDEKNTVAVGKVILAGAGPGDAELITLKLQKRLAIADVIICDRLVNPEIIALFAKKDVVVIGAGKQGYNEASKTQDEINQLIVDNALKGLTVLRLKGGDVAFFSNVLDELYSLKSNGIPFEIIPGITAAAGASAYTGIPLTARGFSQGVQWVTFNPSAVHPPEKWKYLVESNDTLVFYMASKNVIFLSGLLLQYAAHKDLPLAIVEQATTPYQKINITSLKNCAVDFKDREFSSPSLVIVGEVINLHHQFKWFEGEESGSIFKELAK
ncbi:uroporphyrinogen-III C-methyltransferase [Parasediminibacterium sp. JCM 36343]|uniref:uroporphyrinogen-III C-methyltransferase n=1 Tax=Parasediminibacterium sp. JCM 36343 TaxID=3374279 RepID=UPI00397C1A02